MLALIGSVAQLDRALASGARGRAFESRRAHSGTLPHPNATSRPALCGAALYVVAWYARAMGSLSLRWCCHCPSVPGVRSNRESSGAEV